MTKRTSDLIVWLGIAAYTLYFFSVCWVKFHSFFYFDFDLAVHDAAMWNMLHGSLFSSILDVPYLGNHMHLIMFLLAPVYALFPSPLTLLFLQTLALALTAIPLYAVSRRILPHSWAALVALLYLAFPATGYVNLYEFHPPAFATLFLACAFYCYETRRFPWFMAMCFLSMLCQENIAFAVIMFGCLALIQRRQRQWVLVPCIVGCVYLAAALTLMAHFNGNTIQYQNIYSHLGTGPADMLRNAVLHPQRLFFTVFRPRVFQYFFDTFIPLAFLPWLSPLQMLPAFPFLLQHMLSARGSEQTIFYHYSAELLPFIFISLAYALRKPGLQRYPGLTMAGIVAVCLTANAMYLGPHLQAASAFAVSQRSREFIRQEYRMLSLIPKDAPVAATFTFQYHLSHRPKLYSFHHAYLGRHTLSSKPYALPADTEYALIDFNDFLTFTDMYSRKRLPLLRKELADKEWHLVDVVDSVVLFSRNGTDAEGFLVRSPACSQDQVVPVALINGSFQIARLSAIPHPRKGMYEAIISWHCLRPEPEDIRMYVDFVDQQGRLLSRRMRPIGYHLYPTYSWQQGQCVEERMALLVPQGTARIMAGFYNYASGAPCEVSAGGASGSMVELWPRGKEPAHD